MAAAPFTIRAALVRVADEMPSIETRLNEADARLGDGDTGTMLARMVGVMMQIETDDQDTVGTYLGRLAKAAARTTGSSFGTLIIAALMAIARSNAKSDRIEPAEASATIAVARKAMMTHGRTEPGAKTVIDSLAHIEAATEGATTAEDVMFGMRAGVDDALAVFRDKPCRVGRARMFKDNSIGQDDPGMLAAKLVVDAIIDANR
ncbi:DAK2 domain-containing protein [Boseongicola sp. H5]|uniref:DAK2 domain-containing protein n=1 Tax=Boseongicola sp. H5 TaxID=2763261 RepID=UPI001B21DFF4|nr:DAK2 domain-containing protein [Boseongicola sp. H5]MBO6921975.1 DAK2 domain-containing protein [Roseicyclus sp.]